MSLIKSPDTLFPKYDSKMIKLDFDLYKSFNKNYDLYYSENDEIFGSIKEACMLYTVINNVFKNKAGTILFLKLIANFVTDFYPFQNLSNHDIYQSNKSNRLIRDEILNNIIHFLKEDDTIDVERLIKNVYYELDKPLIETMKK